MTSNRFLLQAGDYDLAYEFRVADLTRVDKTKEDFWNSEAEVYEYLEYLNYLYMNGAFLTMKEANKIFNGLHKENAELQHKLSQQEMEYATDLHRLAEENRELEQRVSFYKDFQKDARELENENEKLEKENLDLSEELDYHKTKCASLETGLFQADRENERLKKEIKAKDKIIELYYEMVKK